MEGRKGNKPLAFPAGVYCSALQVCSEKGAASRSYQSPVKQKHYFSLSLSTVTYYPRTQATWEEEKTLSCVAWVWGWLNAYMYTDRHHQRSLKVLWVFPTSLTWKNLPELSLCIVHVSDQKLDVLGMRLVHVHIVVYVQVINTVKLSRQFYPFKVLA